MPATVTVEQTEPSTPTRAIVLAVTAPRTEAERVLRVLREEEFELEAHRAELQRVAAEYQAKLKLPAALVKCVALLEERSVAARLDVEAWAKANRAEFNGKQSLEVIEGATLAFRQGQRCVGLIENHHDEGAKPGKWSFGKALTTMLKNMRRWRFYIRRKPELDKEKILAATATLDSNAGKAKKPKLTPEQLAQVGLKVEQEETFSIELQQPASTLSKQE